MSFFEGTTVLLSTNFLNQINQLKWTLPKQILILITHVWLPQRIGDNLPTCVQLMRHYSTKTGRNTYLNTFFFFFTNQEMNSL